MKKYISILLILVMAISLCACGSTKRKNIEASIMAAGLVKTWSMTIDGNKIDKTDINLDNIKIDGNQWTASGDVTFTDTNGEKHKGTYLASGTYNEETGEARCVDMNYMY